METINVDKWQEFRDYIDSHRQEGTAYWRGHANPDWPLASSFERLILHLKRTDSPTQERGSYHDTRDRYLKEFREASSGLRGLHPQPLNDDQWWALGRHYGLVTPLLDWTEKPYIAAFFALTSLSAQMRTAGGIRVSGEPVAVYRLFHNEQLEGDGLHVVRPQVDELGRMHGQRGLFTWLDSETYFELQGFLEATNRGGLLTRILISKQAGVDGLIDLSDHGIDYRTLYPDMMGAALYANIQVELPS